MNKEIGFTDCKRVVIKYGPYEEFFTYSHKPQKLRGLIEKLKQYKFCVVLQPIPYINTCIIEIKNREIFRCNIKYFDFNMECKHHPRDNLCLFASKAIFNAAIRFQMADSYFWLKEILEKRLFEGDVLK